MSAPKCGPDRVFPGQARIFLVRVGTLAKLLPPGLSPYLRGCPMFLRLTLSALVLSACSGCAVVAVGDAVVTTAAVVVKTGVKATGAVIGAVIPD